MQNHTEEQKRNVLEKIEQKIQEVHEHVHAANEPVFSRYPFTFALLGTLGIAAVIYGFERVVDTIPILGDNPLLILVSGLLLLFLTGGLYKSLQR